MAKHQKNKYTKRHVKTSSLSIIVSMTLVLYMLGLLGLIILHTNKLSNYVKENIGFSVIMKENVKEVDIIQLQKTLDATNYVKSTEYITKEQAAKDLTKDLDEDFVSFLGYNPLLSSIDIHLKANYANIDSLSVIEKNILENKNVKEVLYQKSLVHLVNENIKKISIILFAFSCLLLIIAIALINNTIRLSVYSKRFLIKTMQLVGATQKFIRKPFTTKGIIQGLLSAFITILLLIITLYFAQKEIPELIDLQDINLFLILFASVVLLGIFISWVSNFFAVKKYLKIKTDYLYF
jgi:cell division transport system permease protein